MNTRITTRRLESVLIIWLLAITTAYVESRFQIEGTWTRFESLIPQLEIELNSSVSVLEKTASFIVGKVGSYTYALNGTNADLWNYSTDAYTVWKKCCDVGGRVFVRNAIYVFSSTLGLHDNTKTTEIVGEDRFGVQLRVDKNIPIFNITKDFFSIRNLQLFVNCDNYNQSAMIISAKNNYIINQPILENLYFYRNYVQYGYDDAVAIKLQAPTAGKGINFLTIQNCEIIGGWKYAVVFEASAGYVNAVLLDDVVDSGSQYGYYLNPSSTGVTNRNSFTNCRSQWRTGGQVNAYIVNGSGNTFQNCKVWDVPDGNVSMLIDTGASDTRVYNSMLKGLVDQGSGTYLKNVEFVTTEDLPFSYIINGRDDDGDGDYDVVWAKNGATEQIDFGYDWGAGGVDGANASAVINSAIGNLTLRRTWKEKIVVKGNYTLNSPITLGGHNYTILDLSEAYFKAADGTNTTLINIDEYPNYTSEIEIYGGTLDGNKNNQDEIDHASPIGEHHGTSAHDFWTNGITLCRVENSKIIGVHIKNTLMHGIAAYPVRNSIFSLNIIEGAGRTGLVYQSQGGICLCGGDSTENNVIDNHIFDSLAQGVYLAGCSRILASDNVLTDNEQGIFLKNIKESRIVDNNIKNSGAHGIYGYSPSLSTYGNYLIAGNEITSSATYWIRLINQNGSRIENNIWDGAGTLDLTGSININVFGNQGFVTENSGTAEASNDDWVSFGVTFPGTPETLILTVQESDARYTAQVKAKNATHFQLYLYDETAGALETVDKTISYLAEYQP